MRLHFEKLELNQWDTLYLLDENKNQLRRFSASDYMDGAWTEWYQVKFIRLSLSSTAEESAYGFKIDEVEIRTDMHPESEYAESYHPYANNLEDVWVIENSSAAQMRLHFKKFELGSWNMDYFYILDQNDNQLIRYRSGLDDTWTEWYGDGVLKLKLMTDSSVAGYGFLVDDVETRSELYPVSEYAETHHPYANNIEVAWDFKNPEATQMRLHFEKIDLGQGDYISILDEYNKELERFSRSDLDGEWTKFYDVNHLRVRFTSNAQGTGYGFKIDEIDPEPTISSGGNEDVVEEPNETEFKVTIISSTETSPTIEIKDITLVAGSDGNYRLVGEATDSDEVAYILINGIKVSDSGSFDTALTLQGDSVDIEAVDTNGEATKINVQISLPDDSDDSSLGIIDNILGILVSLGAVVVGFIKRGAIAEKLGRNK